MPSSGTRWPNRGVTVVCLLLVAAAGAAPTAGASPPAQTEQHEGTALQNHGPQLPSAPERKSRKRTAEELPSENGTSTGTEPFEAEPAGFIGVMGEVARPGVYAVPASRIAVADFIRRVGGLTSRFSGTLRVVRHIAEGYRAAYVVHSDFSLRPGDVLIADTADTGKEDARLTERAARYVQLSFVNLTSRPVVVKWPEEDARIATILSRLDQPDDVLETLQVFTPPGAEITEIDPETPLPSGSVIIFDRNVLVAENIPAPPPPLPLEKLPEGGPKPPSGSASAAAAEVQLAAAPAEEEASDARTGVLPSEKIDPEIGGDGLPADPDLWVRAPLTNDRSIHRSALIVPGAAVDWPLPEETNSKAGGTGEGAGIGDTDMTVPGSDRLALDDLSEEPASLPGEASRVWWTGPTFLVVAIGAVVMGGFLLVQWTVRRSRAAAPVDPRDRQESHDQRSSAERIDDIINDRLPIVLERPELPRVLAFSRQAARTSKVRIDAAHRQPSPHFDRPAHQPDEQQPAHQPDSAAAPLEVAPPSGVQRSAAFHRPHVVLRGSAADRSREQRAGVLDRTLWRLQEGTLE